jgi:UDP-glucose 4-epimerase
LVGLRILVTGGAGYIGSVVVQALAKERHQVVVYDNLTHGHAAAVSPEAELIQGDISDREKLDFVFSRSSFDAVMHFAASIEAGESMQVPERYFRNNSAGSLTLLESMLAHNVKRLVFSSTAALYGNPERVPISEDDPLRPTNVYGESKLLVEQMLTWLNRIHGLRYCSLRYFNAAGASGELGEAHHPESHLIPLILQAAAGQRDAIRIFGTDYPTEDGTCIRDYIHVSDLATAHLLALQALDSHSRLIYNLGNGRGFSVREVIEAARNVTRCAIPVIEDPPRAGDPAILVASSEKIRRELNWRPQYPQLEKIIESAWQWMQAHPDGYAADREQQVQWPA